VGAGRLASVDGPWANDTIAYVYDELGRVVGRTINTTANEVEISYDALGRVSQITNPLGVFDYTYVNATGRLASVAYPNSQVTNFDYWPNTAASAGNGDQRLKEIENLKPNSSNLSTFGYTYDLDGIITSWSKKFDAGSVLTSAFKYDRADQLTDAEVATTGSPINFYWRYDKAGNRTSEQIDATSLAYTINNLNQATAQAMWSSTDRRAPGRQDPGLYGSPICRSAS
jgi:YD repeat-containing protein